MIYGIAVLKLENIEIDDMLVVDESKWSEIQYAQLFSS